MTSPGIGEGISRRNFGIAAASLTFSVVLPDAAFAAGPSQAEMQHASVPSDGSQAQAEIEAKLQSVIRKYGHRLSDAQRAKARNILSYHQKLLDNVRAFPLQNGDSPANVLKLTAGASSDSEPGRHSARGES